jgi:putative ABC transport system permease protein
MNYRDIVLTANNTLRKSKLRTFLTISAVFIGTLTLMLTTGVGEGLKSYVDEQVGSIGAKDALFITPITEGSNPFESNVQEYDPEQVRSSSTGFAQALLQQSDLDKIAAEPGILEVTPLYPTSPDYFTSGGKKYVTVLTQTIDGLIQPMRTGKMVEQNAKDYQITLPSEYVQPLGFSDDNAAIGKTVTFGFTSVLGEKFEVPAKIVGIQEKALVNGNQTTGNLAFIRDVYNRTTQGLSEEKRSQYPNAFAKYDINMSAADLTALQQRLKDQKYDAITLEQQLGIIKTIIDAIITFLNIFAGITLAAATFGIVNTLLMAVQERTREIGLMKALGMRRRKIFMLFSFEAILIGFWGSVIALIFANIIGRIGSSIASNTIFKDFEGLQLFSFPLFSMIPIIILIMFIAFLAATLPARRASRLDPIDALRYE